MMTISIETSLATIANEVKNINKRFDNFEKDIKTNYITHNSHELLITKTLDEHTKDKHKSIFSNQKILLIGLVLLTSGAGGAGGDLIRSLIGG